MVYAINVENLHNSYGNVAVLKGLSFKVKKGEIFALLGGNGSGKTTILECIEGIRKYNSASISVDGSFGVQLQSITLPKNIKVIEALTLFSKWNSDSIN
ncbi:ATP-binding cassette domain-containing protein [Ornithinibacillus sp. 4-3]|uniref:ATP-binding cassette domain-containing protein n=1 Tax=Ornithinibacillus sp. 4-3 TaxID=3231488 RepID=A0AB39HMZ5_9BACI